MSAQLDQVSADLHQFEAEQDQAERRAAFVAATRNEWLGQAILPDWQPTALYSFIVGFAVYSVLAAIGLQGKTVPYAPAGEPGA